MSSESQDQVLTTYEAMEYLKISRPTLLKLIHSGKIKAAKAGRGWRMLLSELNRFLTPDTDEIASETPHEARTCCPSGSSSESSEEDVSNV